MKALDDRRTERWIFVAFLMVRLAFILVSNKLHLDLDRDNERYDQQSTAILQGNFDLETPLFITSPFYSYYQALHKLVFGGHWRSSLGLVQLLLNCFSGVVLFRIAQRLFDRRVALLSAAIYCVFPLTLLWVNTLAQDMPFQLHLIFFIHALQLMIERRTWKWTLVAASLFALTFLTKSHILLFAPFIPIIIWTNMQGDRMARMKHILLFVAMSFVWTLPYGLYNLRKHDMYVLSSTGQGGHFITGHNEDVYTFIVHPPPMGSPEHRRIFNMDYMILRQLEDTLRNLPHKEKQRLYLQEGLRWCRENPGKCAELSAYDLYYFLLPGVNYHHYSRMNWLAMFICSLPLYVLAYLGIVRALRADFRKHQWILWLVVSMVLFSVVFYVQNRFRTITLEPYYIIYASASAVWLMDRYGWRPRWLSAGVPAR